MIQDLILRSYIADIVSLCDIQVDAPISDLKPLWRKAIKCHKLVACDRCLAYQAVSVISMVYHYERCGRVSTHYNTMLCTR